MAFCPPPQLALSQLQARAFFPWAGDNDLVVTVRYPEVMMLSDIRAADTEGALILAAWRWWSTEI